MTSPDVSRTLRPSGVQRAAAERTRRTIRRRRGVNVVMIDGVDTGKITLATLWVEPTLSATTDLSEVLRQSTTLQDFVKK